MTRWQRLKERLRQPLQLRIIDAHTFEERFGLQATLGRVGAMVLTTHLAVILMTVLIVFFTPVREWIPGYIDNDYKQKQQVLLSKLEYLENKTAKQDSFINALQRASGYVPSDTLLEAKTDSVAASPTRQAAPTGVSETAATFRRVQYVPGTTTGQSFSGRLIWPVEGTVSRKFSAEEGHFAVDIATAEFSTVHAVAEGRVILAEYSSLTGHVMGIEHPGGLISFYKHNQRLLKQVGEFVFAGEAIAAVGNTGQHTTGPHLHLELWLQGRPLNPLEYLSHNPL